jgi:hypothetical protein
VRIDLDVWSPLQSLKAQGVVCHVSQHIEPSTLTLGQRDVTLACEAGLRFDFTLQSHPEVSFVLAPEPATHRFFKFFSDELQLHDAPFDHAVYITTDDRRTLARWLADSDLRALILIIVGAGGLVVAWRHHLLVLIAHEEGQSEADATLSAAALATAWVNFGP